MIQSQKINNSIKAVYVIIFTDCNNNVIKVNSFNPKDFEKMKTEDRILDYEIDENGVKVIKRIDVTSVSLYKNGSIV